MGYTQRLKSIPLAGLGLILASGPLHAQTVALDYLPKTLVTSQTGANHGTSCGYSDNCNPHDGFALDERLDSTLPAKYLPTDVHASVINRAISGTATCGTVECSGTANHTRLVYAAAPPGTSIRLNIKYSLSVSGELVDKYATLSFNGAGYSVPDGALSEKSGTLSVIAKTGTSGVLFNGRWLYPLGELSLLGKAGGTSGTASFSGSVSEISARYIGKALFYNGGGGQTGRTEQTLPLAASVKLLDETTNSPVTGNIRLTFLLTDPNGATTNLGYAWTDYYSGIADKAIPLDVLPGTYTITAVCPDYVCVEGGRTVTMTAYARGKALVCEGCQFYGPRSRTLPTPFRLKVVDRFDGSVVKKAEVTYDFLRFTGTDNTTSADPHGAEVQTVNGLTDDFGISRASLKLGTENGVYAVRARCATCLEGQEQIPTGTTRGTAREINPPEETAGDPYLNQEPCPSGCCPRTPVLRAWAQTLNGGRTFTSAAGESTVTLKGYLLPLCLGRNADITWSVTDDAIDHNGGTPAQPDPGPSSVFVVGSGDFDNYPQGRALPLEYKITANYDHNGTPVTSRLLRVKQDEIDKCRQEYVDYGIPLTEITRSAFTIGTHPQYSQDVQDCYAYIYPAKEANVVTNLIRAGYVLDSTFKVSSGYRSPRASHIRLGSTIESTRNSEHVFGKAVDIGPLPRNAQGWENLWTNQQTVCPKSLERTPEQVMEWCNGAQTVPSPAGSYPYGSSENYMYSIAHCIHLGNAGKSHETDE